MFGMMVSYEKNDNFELARQNMVANHLVARDISDPNVLEAMVSVPREEFVNGRYLSEAYADRPLPIGMGQTISQPYIVALMTQALELKTESVVLEIGTGCGYQTAILSHLCDFVYTIERFHDLSEMAQRNLEKIGVANVEYAVADGSKGWPDEKEFDGIIVTAAVPHLPAPLIVQLKEGGRIVAPQGGKFTQELIVGIKTHGHIQSRVLCGCRFVPLIGQHGFSEAE